MAQVAAQILQLLFDAAAPWLPARTLLFGDGQIRGPGFPAVGSGFVDDLQVGAQGVDDLFTEFTCFVQKTQIGGEADGLLGHGGIDNRVSAMCRFRRFWFGLLRGRRGGITGGFLG